MVPHVVLVVVAVADGYRGAILIPLLAKRRIRAV